MCKDAVGWHNPGERPMNLYTMALNAFSLRECLLLPNDPRKCGLLAPTKYPPRMIVRPTRGADASESIMVVGCS